MIEPRRTFPATTRHAYYDESTSGHIPTNEPFILLTRRYREFHREFLSRLSNDNERFLINYQLEEAHGRRVPEIDQSTEPSERTSGHTSPISRVNLMIKERLTRDRQHVILRTGHVLNDIEWSFVWELRTDWAQRPVSPYLMPPPPGLFKKLLSNIEYGGAPFSDCLLRTLRG